MLYERSFGTAIGAKRRIAHGPDVVGSHGRHASEIVLARNVGTGHYVPLARALGRSVRPRAAGKREDERRPPSAEERETLTRFAGFGAVALSMFPDPVTGRSPDHGVESVHVYGAGESREPQAISLVLVDPPVRRIAPMRWHARIEPAAVLETALGPLASATTRQAVARAESKAQALTFVLMAPEFQRR